MSKSHFVANTRFLRDFAVDFHQDRRVVKSGRLGGTVLVWDREHVVYVNIVSVNKKIFDTLTKIIKVVFGKNFESINVIIKIKSDRTHKL